MYQKLFSIFYLVIIGIPSSFGQLYPVHDMTVKIENGNSSFNEAKVQSFSISNLITVNEFNLYLQSVKKDSSEVFYNSQLPSSKDFNEKIFKYILTDSKLQNEAIPGVSWTVARNYCTWLTHQSKNFGQNYNFDLPTVAEIIAFKNLYGKLDLEKLESWTLNSFNESLDERFKSFNYQFNAKKSDPTAMKRKVFFGGSFHMKYKPNESYRDFQYEYQDSSSRYIGFRIVRKIENSNSDTFIINDLKISYSLVNNHFEGIYQERYKSGKLKVLGNFSDGQRTGIWTIWDTTGSIKIQRNYQNNKICEFIFPKVNNPYSEIYSLNPVFVLEKNDQNIYPYFHTEERAVVYSKRIWRELNVQNEPDLFFKIDFKHLTKEMFKIDLKWFRYGESGDFKSIISNDSIINLELNSENWDFNRIEIKEDFFFNTDILMTDTRQVALSFYKNDKDKKPSYTTFFPWVRPIIGKIEIDGMGKVDIKTVDDLFFFHAYRGKIISCGNVYANLKTESLDQTDLECELEKSVIEHDLWIIYGR